MKSSSHVLIGSGIILIIIAGAIFGFATRTDWIETSAEVTDVSEVSQFAEEKKECRQKTYDSEGNSRCTSYRTYVLYTCNMFVQYEFENDGQMYQGMGIDSYSSLSDRNCLQHQQERRDMLRINGTMVSVYFDLKDPSINHYPEPPSVELLLTAAIACAGIGSTSLIFGLWRLWRGHSPSRSNYTYRSSSSDVDTEIRSTSNKWGLAPSRIVSYNHAVEYLQSNDLAGEEDMRKFLETAFHLRPEHVESFFQNKYVRSILFPEQTPPVLRIIADEDEPPSFESLVASGMSSTRPAQVGENTCEQEGCSNAVNDFDFRCFNCRKWLCDEHQGQGIHCPECA